MFDWNHVLGLLAPVVSYVVAYFLHRAPKAPPEQK